MSIFALQQSEEIRKINEILNEIQGSNSSNISLSMSSNLFNGSREVLYQQEQVQVQEVLDSILNFLYGNPNKFTFLRMTQNNEFSDVMVQEKGFMYILMDSLKTLIQNIKHKTYEILLRKLKVLLSINYGQITITLDSEQNHIVNHLDEIFNNKSGGGDPSLFIDSPIQIKQAFHFLLAQELVNPQCLPRQFYNIFEMWVRIGFKGFPPQVVLMKGLLNKDEELVPQEPILLIEINAIPSTRQAFLQINPTKQTPAMDNMQVKYIDTFTEELESLMTNKNSYCFVQKKSIATNEIEKLPVKYHLFNNVLHIADVFQELMLAPVQDQLFELSTYNFLYTYTQMNIVCSIHKYYQLQINYLVSLFLTKQTLLQQQIIIEQLKQNKNYKAFQQILAGETHQHQEFIKQIGYDGLVYLDQLGLIKIGDYMKRKRTIYQPYDTSHKFIYQSGITYTYSHTNMIASNSVNSITNKYPIYQDHHTQQSKKIDTQASFLQYVYNTVISPSHQANQDKNALIALDVDKDPFISERYYAQLYESFLPDVITIPGFTLHPYAMNKDQCQVQLDLGCFKPQHRLSVFAYMYNVFSIYFSKLQMQLIKQFLFSNQSAESMSNTTFDSKQLPSQFQYQAYAISNQLLTLPIFQSLNIKNIFVTRSTPGESLVSLVRQQVDAHQAGQNNTDGITLIMRIINFTEPSNVNELDVYNETFFNQTMRTEFEYFYAKSEYFDQLPLQCIELTPIQQLVEQIMEKTRLRMFSGIISMCRGLQQISSYYISNEVAIKIPKHIIYQYSTSQVWKSDQSQLKLLGDMINRILCCQLNQPAGVIKQLWRLINTTSSLIFGLGIKQQSLFGTDQSMLLVQYNKLSIFFDNISPIQQYNISKIYRLPSKFKNFEIANSHIDFQDTDSLQFNLQKIVCQKNGASICCVTYANGYNNQQTENFLDFIIINNNLTKEEHLYVYGYIINDKMCDQSTSIIVRNTNTFLKGYLIIEINIRDINNILQQIHLESITTQAYQKPILLSQGSSRIAKQLEDNLHVNLLRNLYNNQQLYSLWVHTIRYALFSVQQMFKLNIQVYAFLESFMGTFNQQQQDIEYMIHIGDGLSTIKVLPSVHNVGLRRNTEHSEQVQHFVSSDCLPVNLLFIANSDCILPQCITPTAKLVQTIADISDLNDLLALKPTEMSWDQFLLALIPASIYSLEDMLIKGHMLKPQKSGSKLSSNRMSVNDQCEIQEEKHELTDFDDKQTQYARNTCYEKFVHQRIGQLFKQQFDYQKSNILADDNLYGFQMVIFLNQKAWDNVLALHKHLEQDGVIEQFQFKYYTHQQQNIAQLIEFKLQEFYKVMDKYILSPPNTITNSINISEP